METFTTLTSRKLEQNNCMICTKSSKTNRTKNRTRVPRLQNVWQITWWVSIDKREQKHGSAQQHCPAHITGPRKTKNPFPAAYESLLIKVFIILQRERGRDLSEY